MGVAPTPQLPSTTMVGGGGAALSYFNYANVRNSRKSINNNNVCASRDGRLIIAAPTNTTIPLTN